MNKFQELTALADKKRKDFFVLKRECQEFGAKLVQGLRAFLDGSEDAIYCLQVNRDHVPKGPRLEFPELCFCSDAFWYFHLGFDFATLDKPLAKIFPIAYSVGLHIGIKKSLKGFTVKLPDKVFQIENVAEQQDCFETIYASLKDLLSSPHNQAPTKFGFTIPNESSP